MGLSQDIENKIRQAVTANESDDFELAAKYVRSAIMLLNAHPRTKREEHETEYTREDLSRMLDEFERKASEKNLKSSTSGGFSGVALRITQS